MFLFLLKEALRFPSSLFLQWAVPQKNETLAISVRICYFCNTHSWYYHTLEGALLPEPWVCFSPAYFTSWHGLEAAGSGDLGIPQSLISLILTNMFKKG